MKRASLLLLPVLLLVVAGCGGDDEDADEPGAFMAQVFTDKLEGNYTRYWEALHPAQQAVVPQEQLAECLSTAEQPELVGVRELDVYDDSLDLQGIPQREAKVVSLRLETREGGEVARNLVTAYAVEVDGSLRWIMSPAELDAFRGGGCP